jgi:hypothetical protein
MIQNNIYMLDYKKLIHLFSDFPDLFNNPVYAGFTGLNKRSFFGQIILKEHMRIQ